jgi:6-phosphogluconolactonase (cycloisomerase 2 family)
MYAYVGSFTNRGGDGINVYRVTAHGTWEHLQHVPGLDNPSFLRIGPDGRTLYAVHGGGTRVSAYAIDPATGHASVLNTADSGGQNPVDFGFDSSWDHVVVANYGSGTVAVLKRAEDGALSDPHQVIQLSGTPGPHPTEQPGPLPHGATPDPTGAFAVIPDKGLDTIFVFRWNAGTLTQVESCPTASGAGPRHAAFHPHLPLLYVVNELDCTVLTLSWTEGRLAIVQCLSTLPEGATTPSTGAEIAVSPSGNCVYASNRGNDSIARFSADPATGLLTYRECTPLPGREPRFFAIDPTGRNLHAAHQNSNTIARFTINEDGALRGGEIVVETGAPVAICYLP